MATLTKPNIKPSKAPETQHTTDYNKFKLMVDNRPLMAAHVQDLMQSYTDNANLIELRPILVNEYMEVVDGQHRLEACKKLGIEVPFQVVPHLTIATAQLMNALQRPWRMIDFIVSYAGSGNPAYQQILRWMDTFDPIGPRIALAYGRGVVNNERKTLQNIRLGKLVIGDKKLAEDRLSKLSDLPVTFWYIETFAMAFLKVLRDVENYDHDRMVNGLKNYTFQRGATTLDNLRELEAAYNWHRSVDIARFF